MDLTFHKQRALWKVDVTPYSVELRYHPSLTPSSPPNLDANIEPNRQSEIKPMGLLTQEKLKAKL